MIRSFAFASLFALGLVAGAAQAQAPRDGSAAALDGNVVGGGVATLSGGGDDATITYSAGGAGGGMALHSQPGRAARFAGTDGDGPVVQYSAPADTNPGREAWLLGGGDNAEVVYIRPR
ncbi:MAG: hypothetical protein AVDCRST_MAG08-924 [uncultured Acetobacteraceae bacterium]|uniref:Uncharacterized protein n=1 Tax=uncultured Acetobacteraceae bacterium TaxID=169975 RepID=A0A6J4HL10_9PROT|nr:MAG: hypothetical protein AVDCRST_MAG08-924 [uncultured Acetobacteraceae bacterium]